MRGSRAGDWRWQGGSGIGKCRRVGMRFVRRLILFLRPVVWESSLAMLADPLSVDPSASKEFPSANYSDFLPEADKQFMLTDHDWVDDEKILGRLVDAHAVDLVCK